MTQQELENLVLDLRVQVQALQEAISALSPRMGMQEGMLRPIMDGEHVGYWQDLFEHGSKAIEGHQINALTHKAQRSYHMDPSGRAGKDWTHVEQASNGDWLAVSGLLP